MEGIYTTHTCAWDVEKGDKECTHSLLILVLEDMDTYPKKGLVGLYTHACA